MKILRWIFNKLFPVKPNIRYCPLCKVYTVGEYVWFSKPEELKGYEGADAHTCKMCSDILKMTKLQIETNIRYVEYAKKSEYLRRNMMGVQK
jgi:hypothetical protein